jgi:hypothetical protein
LQAAPADPRKNALGKNARLRKALSPPQTPADHRPKIAVRPGAKHRAKPAEKFLPTPRLLLTFAIFKGKIKQKLCKKSLHRSTQNLI